MLMSVWILLRVDELNIENKKTCGSSAWSDCVDALAIGWMRSECVQIRLVSVEIKGVR